MTLAAKIWAYLLALWAGKKPAPTQPQVTRVGYKRKGFNVYVIDLQTHDQFMVRGGSVPEAKAFIEALTIGAMLEPETPARELSKAARETVNRRLAA